MLNIAFGQSKYFVDNLSENVKRGLRQKLRRGEWPGKAPEGYTNDLKTRTVIIDLEREKIIRKLFETYATGDYGFCYLADMLSSKGLRTKRDKKFSVSMVVHILQNPFYYGVSRFNGEIHEAKHESIISKRLYDQVQTVMQKRGRSHNIKKHEYAFYQWTHQVRLVRL